MASRARARAGAAGASARTSTPRGRRRSPRSSAARPPRQRRGRAARRPRRPLPQAGAARATSPPSVDAGDTIVVSMLGGVPLAAVRAAYPGARSTGSCRHAVEIRSGAIGIVDDDAGDPAGVRGACRSCSPALGEVVVLPEAQLDVATGRLGRRPAYVGARRRGPDRRRPCARGSRRRSPSASSAPRSPAAPRCCSARDLDTLAVRREVTSPGGVTARGLDALEARRPARRVQRRAGRRARGRRMSVAVLVARDARARRSPTTSRR